MQRLVQLRAVAVVLSCLALAGCGKSSSDKAKAEAKQFVVVSAVDCADNTGLEFDKCLDLMQKAIAEHDKSAASYPKLDACEKAEGTDRCERIEEKKYRARLTAFQITMSDKPVAIPLYSSKDEVAGFRTAANANVLPDADAFTFTKSATDAAHLYSDGKNKKKGSL